MSIALFYPDSSISETSITPILEKILTKLNKEIKKDGVEYEPVEGFYKACLTAKEQKVFLENIPDISYVTIEQFLTNNNDGDFLLQRKLNAYIDKELYASSPAKKKEIDYFAFPPFKKIGNNNLDIPEDNLSAGLLYSL